MLNSTGNTSPIAASSRSSRVDMSSSTSITVSTPVAAAARISRGELRLWVKKNPTTMPGRIAWLMASLIMAILRSTRNVPGNAHAAATTTTII